MSWKTKSATWALITTAVLTAGCVNVSGGTWAVRSAPLPEGWPELTPVGEVEVREYPTYRAARVEQVDLAEDGQRPLFRTLFDHIRTEDIAMTAPVEMEYAAADDGALAMSSMAFLYRSTELGDVGADDAVVVRDLEPRAFASVGMRGRYTTARFADGVETLTAWLDEPGRGWVADGPPRYLGYNGPFLLPFLRYGEVQVPVAPRDGVPVAQTGASGR